MNKFFKSTISECFLYVLLCIFFFASTTLLGCFIAGNLNVFEWDYFNRIIIVVVSVVLTLSIKVFKETR